MPPLYESITAAVQARVDLENSIDEISHEIYALKKTREEDLSDAEFNDQRLKLNAQSAKRVREVTVINTWIEEQRLMETRQFQLELERLRATDKSHDRRDLEATQKVLRQVANALLRGAVEEALEHVRCEFPEMVPTRGNGCSSASI